MAIVSSKNEDALRELRAAFPPRKLLHAEVDILTYSYDGALDRGRPTAVVLAEDVEDVRKAVRIATEAKVPFVARGAGTNLSGGCIPIKGGVVISLARMKRILKIDTAARVAVVEPGVINMDLQKEAEKVGLFYAPDPASHRVCTLGGNVAENSGGPRCLKYGVTTNHVIAAEMVLPSGETELVSLEDAGPDLLGLFVGAEGTLGIATRLWLRLTPMPETIETILVPFSSIENAIQAVSDIVSEGIIPRVLEAMDRLSIQAVEEHLHAGYPTDADAVLLIELDGNKSTVEAEGRTVKAICERNRCISYEATEDPERREKLWEGRRGAYPAMARIAPNVLVEDGAVPRDRLPEALKTIKAIAAENDLQVGLLFHAGDGNLHPNIAFDDRNLPQVKRAKRAGYEMLKACIRLGGSISGEHGIGVDKRRAMSWLFEPNALELFRSIKKSLDPMDLCNPDKIIPIGPRDADENLRPKAPPSSPAVEELVREMTSRSERGVPSLVVGTGSRLPSAWKEGGAEPLSTRDLNQVLDFDPGNLTLTVEAGVLVSHLKRDIEKEGFFLPLPDREESLGGLIASKALPGFRDEVLGARLLSPDGSIVDLSNKVMKNVAGYDVLRFLFGSWGGYAVLLDVTMKIYRAKAPVPEAVEPKLFRPGNLHRELKRAFDPRGLLNPVAFAAQENA